MSKIIYNYINFLIYNMSNFLIVGFERTGSTTLARNLGKHPKIFMKEDTLL